MGQKLSVSFISGKAEMQPYLSPFPKLNRRETPSGHLHDTQKKISSPPGRLFSGSGKKKVIHMDPLLRRTDIRGHFLGYRFNRQGCIFFGGGGDSFWELYQYQSSISPFMGMAPRRVISSSAFFPSSGWTLTALMASSSKSTSYPCLRASLTVWSTQ